MQTRRAYDDIASMVDVATDAADRSGDIRGRAALLHMRGMTALTRTRYDDAKTYLEQSESILAGLGDVHGRATAAVYLGAVERAQGRDDPALEYYERCADWLRDSADRSGYAFALRSAGQVYLGRREFGTAETLLSQALSLVEAAGSISGQAQVRFHLSMLRIEQDRLTEAEEGLRTALGTCRTLDDRPGEVHCLRGLGVCYDRLGRSAEANDTFRAALGLAVRPHPTQLESLVRATIAAVREQRRLRADPVPHRVPSNLCVRVRHRAVGRSPWSAQPHHPDRVRAAAAEVRLGRTVSLAASVEHEPSADNPRP